jgi:hypothetical protein
VKSRRRIIGSGLLLAISATGITVASAATHLTGAANSPAAVFPAFR